MNATGNKTNPVSVNYQGSKFSLREDLYFHELISKCRKMFQRQCIPLEFTTLVCLSIQQVIHAEAVNSNLTNQLKRGNFEIASHSRFILSTRDIGNIKILLPEIEGYIYEPYEHRHFDKWSYDCGKGGARVDPEHGNSDGNGQFEIV